MRGILNASIGYSKISAVVALEIPSLVPKESKLSLADSLGIIKHPVQAGCFMNSIFRFQPEYFLKFPEAFLILGG
jgi:hypothetical protein